MSLPLNLSSLQPFQFAFSWTPSMPSYSQLEILFLFDYICEVHECVRTNIYINQTSWLHFGCLCVYGFKTDHSTLDNQ